MNDLFGWDFKYSSQRMPILANNIVSTSQPLASQAGQEVTIRDFTGFGGGQIIFKLEDGYLGASDWRKDGHSVGF